MSEVANEVASDLISLLHDAGKGITMWIRYGEPGGMNVWACGKPDETVGQSTEGIA